MSLGNGNDRSPPAAAGTCAGGGARRETKGSFSSNDNGTRDSNHDGGAVFPAAADAASEQGGKHTAAVKSQEDKGKSRRRRKKKGSNNNNISEDNKNKSQSNEQGTMDGQQQKQGQGKNCKQQQHKGSLLLYPPYMSLEECYNRYNAGDKMLAKGTLRVLPAPDNKHHVIDLSKSGSGAFVSRCDDDDDDDRCGGGMLQKDIYIPTVLHRNRAMDGDTVFVELIENDDDVDKEDGNDKEKEGNDDDDDDGGSDEVVWTGGENDKSSSSSTSRCKHNDNNDIQTKLWNPIRLTCPQQPLLENSNRIGGGEDQRATTRCGRQRKGRVVALVFSSSSSSSSSATTTTTTRQNEKHEDAMSSTLTCHGHHCRRTIIGTLKEISANVIVLNPIIKSLPQFNCPAGNETRRLLLQQQKQQQHQHQQHQHQHQQQKQQQENHHHNNTKKKKNNGVERNGNDNNDCKGHEEEDHNNTSNCHYYYQAEYVHGSWKEQHRRPPCVNVRYFGQAGLVEHEIRALLIGNNVNHGAFPETVIQDVHSAFDSGSYQLNHTNSKNNSTSSSATAAAPAAAPALGWKPTADMCRNRRDLRDYRIFTIDPATAKDLDDAVHIRELDRDTVEVGVHIADVSYFVKPASATDREAAARATTVYLVDRVIPMLPSELSEIACSLNENVDRLAFSVIWNMNKDGTLLVGEDKNNVWYGRTIIRSCARLDYSTAQNIIDNKVATGEAEQDMDESLWPIHRRPSSSRSNNNVGRGGGGGGFRRRQRHRGGNNNNKKKNHTIDQVAADVRLMHRVAMARRKLRYDNGALVFHGMKLTFQVDYTPEHEQNNKNPEFLAAPEPYIIRDSNRLVEEFMLLANYLVAQRLITYCGTTLAVLRRHPEPDTAGIQKVADTVTQNTTSEQQDNAVQYMQQMGFDYIRSSQDDDDGAMMGQSHHVVRSTSRSSSSSTTATNSNNNSNDSILQQSITQLMMTQQKQAEYFCSGQHVQDTSCWRHYALNIPYYTHFTSPIRRYPDILVHRLLQATIDTEQQQQQQQQQRQETTTKEGNNHQDNRHVQQTGAAGNGDGDGTTTTATTTTPFHAHGVFHSKSIELTCKHCNSKRIASKRAQEQSDRLFLALYVQHHPMRGVLGVVLSVGSSSCTVFVPEIGVETLLYLAEHKDVLTYQEVAPPSAKAAAAAATSYHDRGGAAVAATEESQTQMKGHQRRILLKQKLNGTNVPSRMKTVTSSSSSSWDTMEIKVFTKLAVTVYCTDTPPIDVKLKLEGPWTAS